MKLRAFIVLACLALAAFYQLGGAGFVFVVLADDISVRQAACEIISVLWVVAALVIALLPTPTQTQA